ncbi:MAG TPA: hypothetical protein VL992_09615, partial [Tepidisphaeraceae bacterium]|nr:hypothetical protein [Tepidisphaeraceae bacterium]
VKNSGKTERKFPRTNQKNSTGLDHRLVSAAGITDLTCQAWPWFKAETRLPVGGRQEPEKGSSLDLML